MLHEIHTADERYPFVEELLVGSFPECERRGPAEQRQCVDSDDRMHCLLIVEDGAPQGFITYWDFGQFRYVEHFAIDPARRCGGIGAAAIREFIGMSPIPAVLEVEMPDDELSRRRIGFYRRQGFELWPCEYVQAPYRPGGESVPMRLMATAPLDPGADYGRIVEALRRHVYKVGG